jgi:dihydrofolate reductase
MKVNLIFCQDLDGNIGKNNKLLFEIPEDLRRFSSLTRAGIVVMGRKTWDSLPSAYRPLPNRPNIVLTTNPRLKLEGACVSTNPYDVVKSSFYADEHVNKDIWIIGGGNIYEFYINVAKEIHQTLVFERVDGDTKAPYIDPKKWRVVYKSHIQTYKGLSYQFITYKRNHPWQPLLNLLRKQMLKLAKLLK